MSLAKNYDISKKKNRRLYPEKNGGRYFILKQLAKINKIIIESYIKEDSIILDFGSGDSPYMELYSEKSAKYLRADITDKENLDIVLNQDGTIPLADNYVNVVISTQVLEHVEDTGLYLSECNRVLKDDGLLLLSTHGHWMYHPDPTDYWRWTQDGLKKLITDYGFQVIEVFGIMNLAATGLQFIQDAISYKFPKFFRKIFYHFIQLLQRFVDRGSVRHRDASVYFIVAIKK